MAYAMLLNMERDDLYKQYVSCTPGFGARDGGRIHRRWRDEQEDNADFDELCLTPVRGR
jgi:hypothetical protein